MRQYTFPVIIEKEPKDPGYFAYSPALPGCFSNGLTVEETREHMREAFQAHVTCLIEDGRPVPQGTHVVYIEEIFLPLPA